VKLLSGTVAEENQRESADADGGSLLPEENSHKMKQVVFIEKMS